MPKDKLPRRSSATGVPRHLNSPGETDSSSNLASLMTSPSFSGRRRTSLTLDATTAQSFLSLPHDRPGDSTPVSAPAPFDTFAHGHPPSPTHETRNPMTYASLPPSPILPSPPSSPPLRPVSLPEPTKVFQRHIHEPPFSLWDYLREELLATDFDSHQELKWERVSNFLNIPFAMEKIIGFGFIVCLDSFLYTFTILPIRFVLATHRLFVNLLTTSRAPLPPSQKADILRTLLLVTAIGILYPLIDMSKIYHSIRGQDTIKLYVIFNALEIADRLCTSFGQDLLDCLFSRSTLLLLSHHRPVTPHTLRPFTFFVLAVLYIIAHGLVLIYHLTSLNVAINSYDHALLTLLVSNQFVEIKGSVFKKFEKDNLFQITCADIVERFTLSVMLFAIAFRNLAELSGSELDAVDGVVLPKSFGWFKGGNLLWTISYPVLTVLMSEIFVDWLKHAFITKFNHLRPSVYERYTDVLCLDLASGSAVGRRSARKHSYVDQSPIVARRLGFPSLPLAVLCILLVSQSITLLFGPQSGLLTGFSSISVRQAKWIVLSILTWICLVVIKILLGVNLISYANRRQAGMEQREEADKINDFGRDPIGEGQEERAYNRELIQMLDNSRDDATPVKDIGEGVAGDSKAGATGKKKRLKLEEITRFTMVKRIW